LRRHQKSSFVKVQCESEFFPLPCAPLHWQIKVCLAVCSSLVINICETTGTFINWNLCNCSPVVLKLKLPVKCLSVLILQKPV
jgi:hypothetical protein